MHEHHDASDDKNKKAVGLRFLSKARVAEYLRGLADNVEHGEIFVEDENASIFLKPHEEVFLEVKAESSRHESSFKLKISWSDECCCGCSHDENTK